MTVQAVFDGLPNDELIRRLEAFGGAAEGDEHVAEQLITTLPDDLQ